MSNWHGNMKINPAEVICPACTHQFSAISVDDQKQRSVLEGRLLAAQNRALYLSKLADIVGYVENSTEQIVRITHDDATRSVILWVCGYGSDSKSRNYHAKSLVAAIGAAWAAGEGKGNE